MYPSSKGSSCTPCHGCSRGTVSETPPLYPQDLSKSLSPPHRTADGGINSIEQDIYMRTHTLELCKSIQRPHERNHTVGWLQRRFRPKIWCFIESACTSYPKISTMRVNGSFSKAHSVGGGLWSERDWAWPSLLGQT